MNTLHGLLGPEFLKKATIHMEGDLVFYMVGSNASHQFFLGEDKDGNILAGSQGERLEWLDAAADVENEADFFSLEIGPPYYRVTISPFIITPYREGMYLGRR